MGLQGSPVAAQIAQDPFRPRTSNTQPLPPASLASTFPVPDCQPVRTKSQRWWCSSRQQQDVRCKPCSGRRDRPEKRPRDTRCSGRPSSPQQPSTVEGPIRAVTARGTKARGCRIRPASERGLLTDSTCTGCDRVHVPGVADLLGILETAGASARQNGPQPYAALVGNPRPTTVCCTPKSGVFLQLTKARCAYPALFSWNQQPSLQPDHASSHCCWPTHCGFLLGWARLARPGGAQGHSSGLACISPGLVAQPLY